MESRDKIHDARMVEPSAVEQESTQTRESNRTYSRLTEDGCLDGHGVVSVDVLDDGGNR